MLDQVDSSVGQEMHDFAKALWPICRSLTGDGVRQTLRMIQQKLPALQIHEVPSGTKCFDWDIPDEWNVRDAFIADFDGKRIVDFKKNNLHLIGYSTAINTEMSLEELRPHLFSLPEQPQAIPYITSYYSPFWGFCLAHEQLSALKPGKYRVVIDSEHKKGSLTYADLILPGESKEEILLSTYVCHPSLANNELSGPVVTVALAQWLAALPSRRYTYRIYFGPETIGAVVYLSRNLATMKQCTRAGWVITCIGDDRAYSLMPSREGDTFADRLSRHVLRHRTPGFKEYSFLQRGSDERQYCSPGADLPVCSIMRSKYGEYPEYHTSLDDLSLVTPAGLSGGYLAIRQCIELAEANRSYRTKLPGEPQLGKRGLYPSLSMKGAAAAAQTAKTMRDFLVYCDGRSDLVAIAERIGVYAGELIPLAAKLSDAGVIERV